MIGLVKNARSISFRNKSRIEENSMDLKIAAVIGVLAACIVVCYARYKSSDFTDAGEI